MFFPEIELTTEGLFSAFHHRRSGGCRVCPSEDTSLPFDDGQPDTRSHRSAAGDTPGRFALRRDAGEGAMIGPSDGDTDAVSAP